MQLSKHDIKIISDFFKDKPVLKAYLFGSYSRNEAEAKSDVDIMVDLDYSTHIGLEFVRMKIDLEKKLNKTVELISSNAVSQHILSFIEKDKVVIYER